MKLDFAFLADAATITDDGLFAVVGGGFDVIEAHGFPAIKSAMVLVGRVVFDPSEFGKTYELQGEIIGASGRIPQPEMRLSMTPFVNKRHPEGTNWITICLNYQGIQFPKAGDYSLRLSVADQVLGEVHVEVVPSGGLT